MITLQERLVSEANIKIEETIWDEDWDGSQVEIESLVKRIILRTIKQTIKEGVLNLPDYKSLKELASPNGEILSDGERITHFCKIVRQLDKSLTDTQHALRGIITN